MTWSAARCGGEDLVRLTATESQLMRIFSGSPARPVSRVELVEELGRDRGQAQERAVDVQITRLRRKIEAEPETTALSANRARRGLYAGAGLSAPGRVPYCRAHPARIETAGRGEEPHMTKTLLFSRMIALATSTRSRTRNRSRGLGIL